MSTLVHIVRIDSQKKFIYIDERKNGSFQITYTGFFDPHITNIIDSIIKELKNNQPVDIIKEINV